ncbi:UbiH/UbiF family hydroxylase [Aurantimonas sp. Leaf443]|uniref:UbiH/UbiF family hydroxylase n=1 Tax=Aurantimonas sp. Leaf443 TaxID=1736378 RepID=UPI0006FC457B|nr:UbiH/UbiF family hydroxylase [Aurantimonas sp. Leaf443]KQT83592.1 2-octaprenyl-6-methoxyphenyl hydroxylase [Aurantimonas sp. Leaf443]
MERREIVVVGGGLAGWAAGLGFACEGFDTLLLAPAAKPDGRSTALIGRSVPFLQRLGMMDAILASAEPLSTMRIVDDGGRLLHAPTVEFHAAEIGLPAFGYNILNADLLAGFEARGEALGARLERREAKATGLEADATGAVVTLEDGSQLRADLVVAADGRRSPMRQAAGIAVGEWSYPQSALVMNFSHRLPHGSVSTEFHTRNGPFTQVPLPGRRSSLVWVEEPRIAELLEELTPEALSRRVEERLHSILGSVEVEMPVQRFPLSGARAASMAGDRLALVGEAGHAFPPIGAQGLNLGLRDVDQLLQLACENRDDAGARVVLGRYAAGRRADVASRSAGVDLLNRSLLTGFLPVQFARSAGLSMLAGIAPLRRFAMREGVSPGAGLLGLPRSLRELWS